jgi:hypothetical protein
MPDGPARLAEWRRRQGGFPEFNPDELLKKLDQILAALQQVAELLRALQPPPHSSADIVYRCGHMHRSRQEAVECEKAGGASI